MPKVKTASTAARQRQARRHNPLVDDIANVGILRPQREKSSLNDADERDKYVDSRASRKILEIGRKLAEEGQEDQEHLHNEPQNGAFTLESRFEEGVTSDKEAFQEDDDDDEGWGDEDEVVEEFVCIPCSCTGFAWYLMKRR